MAAERGEEPVMSTNSNPVDSLEIRALQQRNYVHQTIGELKGKVAETRAKFDVNSNARAHFGIASLIVSAVALLAGYGFAGMFTRH